MAWSRWRVDSKGVRTAQVQWRGKDGKVHSRALGAVTQNSVTEAVREAAEVNEGRSAPRATVEARDALRRFLTARRAIGRSTATIDFYQQVLGDLFDALAARAPIARWTRAHLAAFIESKRWTSGRTIQMRVVACRSFVKWARAAGLEVPDFVAGYVGPSVSTPETKHYTPAQADRLVAACHGEPIEVPVVLALDVGLSWGDLESLAWSEVNVRDGWIERPEGRRKTGELLRVPLTDRAREVLGHTPESKRVGLVCAAAKGGYHPLTNVLRRRQRRAKIPVGGWHRLRHSCGARLVALGVPLPAIRRWLGHAPGSMTTLRYLHADDSMMLDAAGKMGRVKA